MNPEARTTLRTVLGVCCLLALAVAVVFGQTVQHEFVNFDDDAYIYNNPHVAHGLTGESVAWSFTSLHASNWHPLTWLSHTLDCQLYGTQHPGLHHLTNVLLHAAVAIALFLVLWQMTGSLWPSAFVAAVFAVHPLRVESVAWVSERKDLLSGLFFMLTLGAYLHYVRHPFSWGRYLLVIAMFALGLMAKPMLVTLPFVLLLLDYWPLGRFSRCGGADILVCRENRRNSGRQECLPHLIVEKLPLLLLAGASCVVTSAAQQKALVPVDIVPISSRIANALVSYVAYIGQFFCPTGLALFYPYPGGGVPIWMAATALAVLAGVSVAALLAWRRLPYLFVGWFWYLGMLVPVIGVVQVGSQAMADRYTYLPQIGLCIAVTWGAAAVGRTFLSAGKNAGYRRWAGGVASAAILAALMACAWRQTSFWRNNETAWSRALACTSHNVFAYNNLGASLAEKHDADARYESLGAALAAAGRSNEAAVAYSKAELSPYLAAIGHYRRALASAPGSCIIHSNLANALAATGRAEEAIAEYRKALRIDPTCPAVHNNLANLLARRGQGDEAMTEYRKAIELKRDYADAHNNLGTLLATRGQVDAAVEQFREALRLKPDFADAHGNLALALSNQGKTADAMSHWREAVRLQPNNLLAVNQLAWAMATEPEPSLRNGPAAAELAQWAVKLSRGLEPIPLATLAAAYAETGRFAEAVQIAERAIALASQQNDAATADALRQQSKLYRAGSPYRQPSRPATHEPMAK
jgi:tetratricopeptide (TPR) repeat protein